MNIDILQVPFQRGIIISLLVINLICPSYIGIFLFEHTLFTELDFFKLAILAVSFNTIFFSVTCLWFFIITLWIESHIEDATKNVRDKDMEYHFLMTATITNTILWLLVALINYVIYKFNFIITAETIIDTMLGFHTCILGFVVFAFISDAKRIKNKKANTPRN